MERAEPHGLLILTRLVELIERQGRELAETREAAAIWQVRALQAEERLQQLTATVEGTESPQSAPSEVQDEGASHGREAVRRSDANDGKERIDLVDHLRVHGSSNAAVTLLG